MSAPKNTAEWFAQMEAAMPAGYTIVPVDPTVEMLKAGCVSLSKPGAREQLMAAELSRDPHAVGRAKMKIRWAAMLAATTADGE